MLTLVQTPTRHGMGQVPVSWRQSEILMILLIPMLIVAFLGLVFVRSRKSQINGMRR
jgi:hypothetical protein